MARSRSGSSPASRAAPRPRPSSAASSGAAAQPAAGASSWFGGGIKQPQGASAPPASHQHRGSAPPPATQPAGAGMFSGLLGGVVQGAAWGTGSAFAHRAVDSVMGPREARVVHEQEGGAGPVAAPAASMHQQQGTGPCDSSVQAFAQCMSHYNGDMGACQGHFEAMQQCKRHFAA